MPTFLLIARIAIFIASLVFGGLTVCNAGVTVYNGDYGSGLPIVGVTGGLTIMSVLLGVITFVPTLLGKLWPAAAQTNVPKELAEAIEAIQKLAASPKDISAQRNAMVQTIEASIAIGQAAVKDPAIDMALAAALDLIHKAFSPLERAKLVALQAPQPVAVPSATASGQPTFAEVLAR